MKELILGIVLMIQSSLDLKHKEIPFVVSLLGAVIGAGFCLAEERAVESIFLSCIPGMAALLFSKLSNEVMGYGDGILFVVMGIYLPLNRLVGIGMLAFGIAGVFALVLLVLFHKKGSHKIPFVPFLALAYWLEYLIELGGVM